MCLHCAELDAPDNSGSASDPLAQDGPPSASTEYDGDTDAGLAPALPDSADGGRMDGDGAIAEDGPDADLPVGSNPPGGEDAAVTGQEDGDEDGDEERDEEDAEADAAMPGEEEELPIDGGTGNGDPEEDGAEEVEQCGNILCDCTFDGIPLWGKVEVVEAFGDIQVEEVSAFADLDVEQVDAFANECGEWEMVDAFGDFTIEIVDSFGDIEVRYVDAFPGIP